MSGNSIVDRKRRQLLAAMVGWGVGPAFPLSVLAATDAKHPPMDAAHAPFRFVLPAAGAGVVGRSHYTSAGATDTLLDIARRHDLGYWDIVLANPGVDVWLPGKGTLVVLPLRYVLPDAPQDGIVVNVPEMRLYYFPPPDAHGNRTVITYPVGIGRRDWSTPIGRTKVTEKIPNPAWYPPASIREEARAKGRSLPRVVPPGPDNPLGQYALILGVRGYLIHGTNRPSGVGMRVSHGCIRLYPEDIARLFQRVPRRTPVYIVNQPFKMAWSDGQLIVEVHPAPGETDYTTVDPSRHFELLWHVRGAVQDRAMAMGMLLDGRAFGDGRHLLSGVPQAVPLV